MKTFLRFLAKFMETVGLGLFVNAIYGFQTQQGAIIVLIESVVLIAVAVFLHLFSERKNI